MKAAPLSKKQEKSLCLLIVKGYFVFSILVAGSKQAYDANERQ